VAHLQAEEEEEEVDEEAVRDVQRKSGLIVPRRKPWLENPFSHAPLGLPYPGLPFLPTGSSSNMHPGCFYSNQTHTPFLPSPTIPTTARPRDLECCLRGGGNH